MNQDFILRFTNYCWKGKNWNPCYQRLQWERPVERVVDVLSVPGLGPDPELGRVRDPDLRPRVRLP